MIGRIFNFNSTDRIYSLFSSNDVSAHNTNSTSQCHLPSFIKKVKMFTVLLCQSWKIWTKERWCVNQITTWFSQGKWFKRVQSPATLDIRYDSIILSVVSSLFTSTESHSCPPTWRPSQFTYLWLRSKALRGTWARTHESLPSRIFTILPVFERDHNPILFY